MSEVLVVPLILAAIAAALQWRSTNSARWLLACGVLVGLATLTRVNAVALLLPLGVAVWGASHQPLVRRAAPAVVLAVVAAFTIAPWTARNAHVFGEFIPVATEDGYTLAGTYNDVARTQTRFPAAWVNWYQVPVNRKLIAEVENTETSWNDTLREHALQYAADHPGYVAKVGWWNMRRVFDAAGLDWLRFEHGAYGLTPRTARAELLAFRPVALLALLGLLSARARALPRWIWLLPIVLLAPVLFTGYMRFRAPLDPLLVAFAAVAAVSLSERAMARWWRRDGQPTRSE